MKLSNQRSDRVLSTGGGRGEAPASPPKGLLVIYIIKQELNFKSQIARVYQQELKFKLF